MILFIENKHSERSTRLRLNTQPTDDLQPRAVIVAGVGNSTRITKSRSGSGTPPNSPDALSAQ